MCEDLQACDIPSSDLLQISRQKEDLRQTKKNKERDGPVTRTKRSSFFMNQLHKPNRDYLIITIENPIHLQLKFYTGKASGEFSALYKPSKFKGKHVNIIYTNQDHPKMIESQVNT